MLDTESVYSRAPRTRSFYEDHFWTTGWPAQGYSGEMPGGNRFRSRSARCFRHHGWRAPGGPLSTKWALATTGTRTFLAEINQNGSCQKSRFCDKTAPVHGGRWTLSKVKRILFKVICTKMILPGLQPASGPKMSLFKARMGRPQL